MAESVCLFVCMGVGKALGGILADRFSARKTALWSVAAALPFMILGSRVMAVSLIGILLFSMSMPITLGILVSVLPHHPGLAFGITTFGLFAGSLPAFFIQPGGLRDSAVVLTVLSAAAFAALSFCLKKDEKLKRKERKKRSEHWTL